MHIAHIVPIAYKNPSKDYIMLLAHLMENEEYVKNNLEGANEDAFIIMDNSIIELGAAMTIEKLCDLGERFHVSEIILPDVFMDKAATLNSLELSMSYIRDRYNGYPPFKLMAVPQGKNLIEWISCWEYISKMYSDAIHTIGIPKVLDRTDHEGRERACMYIGTFKPSFDYHLLGMHHGLADVAFYPQAYPWVRGIDSCMAYIISRDLSDYNIIPDNIFKIPRPDITINFEAPLKEKTVTVLKEITRRCGGPYEKDPLANRA